MDNYRLKQIKENLSVKLKQYVEAIIDYYGDYIPSDRLDFLMNISNFQDYVSILDIGSITAFANSDGVIFPLCADKILKMAKMVPFYGINKKHRAYNDDSLLVNNNTFVTYMFHAFIKGLDAEGYYEEMMLHEVMHFCGSGGGTALREGINEYLTRKLAKEKGLLTNGCGYPKEVQIAFMLEGAFGEDVINTISFIPDDYMVFDFLLNSLGEKAAYLYSNVSSSMEKEFASKYYSNIDNYGGILGPIKKTNSYSKLDYSEAYELIEESKKSIKSSRI